MPADPEVTAHVEAAQALTRTVQKEALRVAQREGGAPWPYARQRQAAQNALLIAGWDSSADLVGSTDGDEALNLMANGLALSASRPTNSPAHRDRVKAALIEVMALGLLIAGQPRGPAGKAA